MLAQILKRIMPTSLYTRTRSIPYWIADLLQRERDETMPPLHLQTDGPRGYEIFRKNGAQTLGFYQRFLSLAPDTKMLDIGCGIGRKTLPLTSYFSPEGRYVGLDIDQKSIDWCSRNISPLFPNFMFLKLDVFNSFYNRKGRLAPNRLMLPFPDASFDVVSLWSVFTHMYPQDGLNYLRECARVLKNRGSLVASYYLMNDRAKTAVEKRSATWPVTHFLREKGCWTTNPRVPEDLIAWEEIQLRTFLAEAGLRLREPLMFGSWSGNPVAADFGDLNLQDIAIAQKGEHAREKDNDDRLTG